MVLLPGWDLYKSIVFFLLLMMLVYEEGNGINARLPGKFKWF